MSDLECHECGQPFAIDEHEIANHLTEDGDIDHDQDADHVPYAIDDDESHRYAWPRR